MSRYTCLLIAKLFTPMRLKLYVSLFSVFFLLMFITSHISFAQGTKAQLVFGLTATYMVMDGGTSVTPINLVLGNDLNTAIASAIYVVKVYNTNNSIAKKVFIRPSI